MTSPDVSLVLVTYYSSSVLPVCIASFRREAEQLGLSHETVLVDCSEDEDELAAVTAAGAERCLSRKNRGYAAGLNIGAEAATGRTLLLANPDIKLLPGSLGALLGGLGQGYQVVGPQLVWDDHGRLLMPIPDDPGPRAEVWRSLRRRHPGCWQLGLGAELDRIRQIWRAEAPVPVPCLRGPLLVLSRDTWHQLGHLDEDYFLYYEETEWLWRAHRRGIRLAVVGNARVVHRWGHATSRRSDRDQIEQRSRQRFHKRNFPALYRWLLPRLGQDSCPLRAAQQIAGANALPEVAADLWLVSCYPHLMPAAGWLGDRPHLVEPPSELVQLTAAGLWYAVAASCDGRWQISGSWCWEVS